MYTADKFTKALGIDLTPQHQLVIQLAQVYYQKHQISPGMRQIVQETKTTDCPMGSIELMRLFGASPAKIICRLANIPPPRRCL